MIVAGQFATAVSQLAVQPSIDPNEILQYFAWWAYAGIAVLYTLLVFWRDMAGEKQGMFSAQNSRSTFEVVMYHWLFVTVLLFLTLICSRLVLELPYWMTFTVRAGRGRSSIADAIYFLLVLGLLQIELKWLFIPAEDPAQADKSPRSRGIEEG